MTSLPIRKSATFVALLLLGACGGGDTPTKPDDNVQPPPACSGLYCDRARLDQLGLDSFYEKVLDSQGIPVVSSAKVSDAALEKADEIVEMMLSARVDVHTAMVDGGAYVGVMAPSEVTTDIPEHAHLKNDPNTDWDRRARGLGGTPSNPITTVGEENLLCLNGDVYGGENILVHEFAHGIHLIGINFVEAGFTQELRETYQAALEEGLWAKTYAETNEVEYWAEGVQSWFDVNQRPQSGIHNDVDTRDELLGHDPRLHDLIARFFPATDWVPDCD